MTYSQWLEYRLEWKTSNVCNIGFYTANYLIDSDLPLSRRTILLGQRGPCLFSGKKGGFFFTDVNEMYVIVDADVSVKLKVKSRVPCLLTFPKLLLHIPILYKTQDECVFATETLISKVTEDVVFLPTKKYAELTARMKQFIIDTSVLLDFSPQYKNNYH